MDGSEITNGNKTGAKSPRYASLTQVVPGHYFSYNDAEGTRATLAAGFMLAEWNVDLAYARWLRWENSIGLKEWGLTFSRPLNKRDFIKGDRIISAPTEAEARSQTKNSIVLAPGDIFASTYFDWHKGQNKHDSKGRAIRTADGREHDFRFLTEALSFGLPKGFEVDALIPFFLGQEQFAHHNKDSPHTRLNHH